MKNVAAVCSTIAMLLTAAGAFAEGSDQAISPGRDVTVQLVSRTVNPECKGEPSVERKLTVCDKEGCRSLDLDQTPRPTFVMPEVGSFTVKAASSYEDVRNAYRHGERVPARFSQTIAADNGCNVQLNYSIVY